MHSIEFYVDAAKEKIGTTSNNALSLALGLSKPQVGFWLARKTLPSDDVIVKLAEAGGQNVDLALLHLNWWRAVSKNEYSAADHYQHMIETFFLQAA
ncbi:helix-turn-helix domain-containing protein [Kordiimonas sp.]|uniref:helix-turn-helix domain-containing protein n=1 Tax=Kordiimonas sp. TaxID=1970157 RepID=UPI003A8F7C6D